MESLIDLPPFSIRFSPIGLVHSTRQITIQPHPFVSLIGYRVVTGDFFRMKSRARASADDKSNAFVARDRSITFQDDEKQSKIQRDRAKQIERAVVGILLLVMFAGIATQSPVQNAARVRRFSDGYSVLPAVVHEQPGFRTPMELAVDVSLTLVDLEEMVSKKEKEVRELKNHKGTIMERDPWAKRLTKELQIATRQLLVKRYRTRNVRVRVDLEFPPAVVEQDGKPPRDFFIIEMAPIDLIPCSVHYFLELVRNFQSGAFDRNAAQVVQASTATSEPEELPMPFQEYSPEFPHLMYTTGYAGRPSGPEWYVNVMDNSKSHGPGSQQTHNAFEADSLFGKIVEGGETTVIPRIQSIPRTGWLDAPDQVTITSMTILVLSSEAGEWVPWIDGQIVL
jgi:hypothetical protein